jgi:protein-disulfide isomerase
MLSRTGRRQEHACEYAQFSLAVWHAAPEAFAEYHGYLMGQGEEPPPVDEARQQAEQTLTDAGAEMSLEEALAADWVDQSLQRSFGLYRVMGQGFIPKLIGDDLLIIGGVQRPEQLQTALRERLGLRVQGAEASTRPASPTSADPAEPSAETQADGNG